MSSRIIGLDGNEIQTDANENLYIRGQGIPEFGSIGGGFSVSGESVGVVAAALAANTMLQAMRFATGSTRAAYLTRGRIMICPATVGVSGGVAGSLVLQAFTAQTPTGGVARTPHRKNPTTGSGTDMTDVRDSNVALTGTAPTFGTILAMTVVPVFTTGGSMEWVIDMDDLGGLPHRFAPGDGLAMRTLTAMAATQTWKYSYTFHYFEK